ncbi:MAG: BON domain-containing protein [Burkholderiales bacterium]|nr:BON domain-containing protein [Burkholderiales bacterium]
MRSQDLTQSVRAALEADVQVNLARYPLRIEAMPDRAVVLEGEVSDIAARKSALSAAARVPGVRGIVDRLRIAVGTPRGDGEIRDSLVKLIERESELSNCTLRVRLEGRAEPVHDGGADPCGEVEAEISSGVITLNGRVLSLTHKRMLGVLAWWTPGCRDVINGIAVVPEEDDSDDEIVDAVRLALEMDPMLKAETISVRCRDAVVTLEGEVRTEAGRRQAELDAWYVFGIERVVNRLRPGG